FSTCETCFITIYIGRFVIVFFFFFSSRRRHTRWPRDWSSDVCSSDLSVQRADRGVHAEVVFEQHVAVGRAGERMQRGLGDRGVRSEERRVGKECRSWWSPEP